MKQVILFLAIIMSASSALSHVNKSKAIGGSKAAFLDATKNTAVYSVTSFGRGRGIDPKSLDRAALFVVRQIMSLVNHQKVSIVWDGDPYEVEKLIVTDLIEAICKGLGKEGIKVQAVGINHYEVPEIPNVDTISIGYNLENEPVFGFDGKPIMIENTAGQFTQKVSRNWIKITQLYLDLEGANQIAGHFRIGGGDIAFAGADYAKEKGLAVFELEIKDASGAFSAHP